MLWLSDVQALAEAFPETFADGGIGSAVAAFVAQAPDVQRLKTAMGPGGKACQPRAYLCNIADAGVPCKPPIDIIFRKPEMCDAAATGLRGVNPARAVTPQGVLHAGTSLAGGCSAVGNKQVTAQLAMECWCDAGQGIGSWHGRRKPGPVDRCWA